MIVVNVLIETGPGTVAALKDAIAALEQATRQEPGCITYAFAADINSPTTIRVVEHWKDVDALKAHLKMPHMDAFNAAVQKNPPQRVEVKMFDATELAFPPR